MKKWTEEKKLINFSNSLSHQTMQFLMKADEYFKSVGKSLEDEFQKHLDAFEISRRQS